MTSRKVVLRFPRHLIEEPVICRLVKEYDLEFNILRALISPQQEGLAVLELSGEEDRLEQGIAYVNSIGIAVQPLERRVAWNEDKCTHCGACIVICPSGALTLDRTTWQVMWDGEECIACELCVPACPPRAMEVRM